MQLGKDLINKPIISIDDGSMLGRVQDIYVDATFEHVAGLYLGSQGLLKRRAQLVDRENIVLFGVDAILARTADAVTDDHDHPMSNTWLRRDEIIGRDINTPGGTRLGVAGDVVIDENGVITAVALSRTFVEGPLASKRTIDRPFILETGGENGVMTADLTALEASLLPVAAEPEEAQVNQTAEPLQVSAEETEETPERSGNE